MRKLILFIFCTTVVTVSAQRTPFNLQSIMSKDVTRKTTNTDQYKKWKMDPSVQTAFLKDDVEQLADLFIRTAPDTVVILEHNTMNEWFVRVQYIRSDADAASYTVDSTGKILEKTRPFTGVVNGSDDGSLKVYKIVDKVDPYVSLEHVKQVSSTSDEAKNLQREVDALLSKF